MSDFIVKCIAYPVILIFSLALLASCSGGSQAAATASAKAAAPTAASLSTATSAPLAAATAAPISASPVVPPRTATLRAVSPTGPAKQATPTGVPAAGQGADWKLHRDESRGIEFRYPAACSVTRRDGSLTVGARIDLAVTDAGWLSLRDYVTRFLDERTRTGGWKVDSQQTVTLGANQGIRVDYRFGGTNRFGTAVFIEGQGRVYTWGLTAGSFTCDEPAAFDGVVSSFRSMPTGPTPTGR